MRLTADDVLDIEVPEHLRGYELEDGELVEVSLPSMRHGRFCAEIARHLGNHVEAHSIPGHVYAEIGCVLPLRRDPERLRGPDVSFVSEAALQAAGGEPERGWLRLVPDLVVEVDSPGRRPAIEQLRIQNYLDAGAKLLWIIHTDAESVTVYCADGSAKLARLTDSLDGDPVLPGFRLDLGDLFRRMP